MASAGDGSSESSALSGIVGVLHAVVFATFALVGAQKLSVVFCRKKGGAGSGGRIAPLRGHPSSARAGVSTRNLHTMPSGKSTANLLLS